MIEKLKRFIGSGIMNEGSTERLPYRIYRTDVPGDIELPALIEAHITNIAGMLLRGQRSIEGSNVDSAPIDCEPMKLGAVLNKSLIPHSQRGLVVARFHREEDGALYTSAISEFALLYKGEEK